MGDTATKIASIFLEAIADAIFDETQISENEKIDKAIKAVKGALDKAHTGTMAIIEAKPLSNVLLNNNRENAIQLLNRLIRKYERFINATSSITGRIVIYLHDPYADKTDDNIKTDIKFTIFFVYFATITEEGVKTAVSKALKGILVRERTSSTKNAESGDM